MTEKITQFVASGARRLAVAFWAIAVAGAVDAFAPGGLTTPGAVCISAITLGYYNTKYAEVLAEVLPIILEKFFGKKAK